MSQKSTHTPDVELTKHAGWQGGSPSRATAQAWLRLEGPEGSSRVALAHRCPQGEWLEVAPGKAGRELVLQQIDELITHHIPLASPDWHGNARRGA